MRSLQKMGGVGALVAAATFVVGLVMYATLLIDYTTSDDPAEAVRFLVDNHLALYLWNLTITIVFGIALVPLALSLHDRVKIGAPALAPVGTVFGVIWSGLILATGMITNIGFGTVIDLYETDSAAATTVWSALDSVQNGLGGGNEIVGGIWVIVFSLAALQAGVFSKVVNYFGLVIGLAGLITVVPALELVGAVFGLGLIVWFVIVGVVLLRTTADQDTKPPQMREDAAEPRLSGV